MGRTLPIPPSLGLGGTGFTSDISGCTGNLPTVIAYNWNLPGYLGSTFPIKICYANVYFGDNWCFQSNGGPPQCGVQLSHNPLIQSIVLPDSTAWTFMYDSGNPTLNTAATGNLLRITFPTGG